MFQNEQIGPIDDDVFFENLRSGKIKPKWAVFNQVHTGGHWMEARNCAVCKNAIDEEITERQAAKEAARIEREKEKATRKAGKEAARIEHEKEREVASQQAEAVRQESERSRQERTVQVGTPPPLPTETVEQATADQQTRNRGFHPQRIAMCVICVIGMMGTFLPWIEVPIFGSVNGTKGDGWITCGLYAIALVLSLMGPFDKPVGWEGAIAIGVGLLASAFGFYKIAQLQEQVGEMAENGAFGEALAASFQVGIGLYMVAFAGLALFVIAALLNRDQPGKESRQ